MLGSMTETRELSRDVYVAIAAALHAAFILIDDAMTAIRPDDARRLTAEWHELHGMMQLASVAQDMAQRGRDQAPDPDAPVPYLPAPCAHDDDTCTCILPVPEKYRTPDPDCPPGCPQACCAPIPPGVLGLEGVYEIYDGHLNSSALAEGPPWSFIDEIIDARRENRAENE
jgi:hypothetical protein